MRITKLHLILVGLFVVAGFFSLKEYYRRQTEARKAREELERIKREEELEEQKRRIEEAARLKKETLAREAIAVAGEYWKIARKEGRDVSKGQATLRLAKDTLNIENDPEKAWELARQAIEELKNASYADKSYTVRRGDTLWGISAMKVHFSDGRKWKYIYLANKPKIKNPRIIFPRQKFTIPVATWERYKEAARKVK